MDAMTIKPVVYQVEHKGHTMTFELVENRAHKEGTYVTVRNEQNSEDFMFRNSNTERLRIIGEMLIGISEHAEKCRGEDTPS